MGIIWSSEEHRCHLLAEFAWKLMVPEVMIISYLEIDVIVVITIVSEKYLVLTRNFLG
jgi:hypothetical protein